MVLGFSWQLVTNYKLGYNFITPTNPWSSLVAIVFSEIGLVIIQLTNDRHQVWVPSFLIFPKVPQSSLGIFGVPQLYTPSPFSRSPPTPLPCRNRPKLDPQQKHRRRQGGCAYDLNEVIRGRFMEKYVEGSIKIDTVCISMDTYLYIYIYLHIYI